MRDYQLALDELRQQFGFDFMSLSIVPVGERPVLTWQYASGNLNNRYKRIVLASGLGILGLVFKSGKPLLYTDVNRAIPRDELVQYPIIIGEGLACLCAIPLWDESTLKAIMLAAFRHIGGLNDKMFDKLLEELADGFEGLKAKRDTSPVHHGSIDTSLQHPENNDISSFSSMRLNDTHPVYDLMSHKILEAQEAERKRISRELHDGVVQELLGVQMLLRQTRYLENSSEKDELIASASERTNHILDDVRRIAVEQRPSSLDTLGLSATLSSYARRQSASFGVNVIFNSEIGNTRFEPTVETIVYRICQEAVVNACKYSGTDDIDVLLLEKDNALFLSVSDKGKGFEPDAVPSEHEGLGLSGMSERAELVEGTFEVSSELGKGTTVTLMVPCNALESA